MVKYQKGYMMKYAVVSEKFKDFILNIDNIFLNKENITLFDNRNIIKIVQRDGIKYVVKSFKIPHFINKIVYRFFRDSKAKRSYENSVRLKELGVNTPKPIGYIENNSLLFFGNSYYVCEYFDYDFEIRAVFKDQNFEDRENIFKEFIRFSFDLHQKGVYHIDYSPGNILVKRVKGEYKFFIIDVNRMKFMDFDNDLRMKTLAKLTSHDMDNKLLASYYSQISNIDEDELYSRLKFHINEQQKYLENKKRLKRLKGTKK
jgi:RIO-like serine/threonine protein kinase